jgi:hypothetical protein
MCGIDGLKRKAWMSSGASNVTIGSTAIASVMS